MPYCVLARLLERCVRVDVRHGWAQPLEQFGERDDLKPGYALPFAPWSTPTDAAYSRIGLVGMASVMKMPIAAFSLTIVAPRSLTIATPTLSPPLTETMQRCVVLPSGLK